MKKSLHKHHIYLDRNKNKNKFNVSFFLVFCSAFLFMTGFCYIYAYLGEFGIPIDSMELESHKILFYGTKSIVSFFPFSAVGLALILFIDFVIRSAKKIKHQGLVAYFTGEADEVRGFAFHVFIYRWIVFIIAFPFIYMILPSLFLDTVDHAKAKKEEAHFFKVVIISGLLWSFVIGVTHGYYSASSLKKGSDRTIFAVIGNEDHAVSMKQIICGESKCAFYSDDKKVAYMIGNEQLKLVQYTKNPGFIFFSALEFICSASFFWGNDCNLKDETDFRVSR